MEGLEKVKIIGWSKKYYEGLTEDQHKANDEWFRKALELLSDTGILGVPNIGKRFNKQGEEVK
tara:strand:- start:213 stop:401 length:189 start_codon:yes stop_codon:yes gene_type:complete